MSIVADTDDDVMLGSRDGERYRGSLRLAQTHPLLRRIHPVIDAVSNHVGERGPERRPPLLRQPELRRLGSNVDVFFAYPKREALGMLAEQRQPLFRRLESPGA